MWDLFTENLNKSLKKNEKEEFSKNIKFKKISKNIKELKIGDEIALSKKSIRNFKKGNVSIENRLDLHGFNEVEARNLLEEFINQSAESGRRLILVITGKGQKGEGVIKNNIVSWLNTKGLRNKILAVTYASNKHGGSGALYILLRKF